MTVDCLPQLCVTAHLRRILLFSRFQVPLQFFRRPWLHILVYCAMAMLYDRAVHIRVDWILDVRHNIKFRLVVLLNRHNDSILVTMLLGDSN